MTKIDDKYFAEYGGGAGYEKQKDNPTFDKRLKELAFLGYEKGRLLDLGCAFGFFLAKAEKAGFQTFGVDISKFAINKAKKNCAAKLYQLDISQNELPFATNFFDVITMFDTLEHLENYSFTLKEAHRVLKKGGVLHIHTPIGERWMVDLTHLNYFPTKILKLVLERFGFKVLRIGEEGGKFQIIFGILRLITRGNTFFNFVPAGTGSFVSCYAQKV